MEWSPADYQDARFKWQYLSHAVRRVVADMRRGRAPDAAYQLNLLLKTWGMHEEDEVWPHEQIPAEPGPVISGRMQHGGVPQVKQATG